MDTVQLIHMERPDPGALTSRQLWRAWVEGPARGTGIVVTEGLVEGGRFVRTEIGASVMIDPDPVVHLQHLIAEKRSQGWQEAMSSTEERFVGVKPEKTHFFQFHAEDGLDSSFVFLLDDLLQAVRTGVADWVNPRQVHNLRKTPEVRRWDTELQLGRDRITVQVGQWKRAVLSAQVGQGCDADRFLTTLAAGIGDRYKVTMTNDELEAKEPTAVLRHMFRAPQWVNDLAYEVGAKVRPLTAEPMIGDNGDEFAPVVF